MTKHTTAGIDFGNQNCVFSLLAKNGIEIISNQSSMRKTPTMINYQDERRFGGEFAQQQQMMNVSGSITHIKQLIGLPFNSHERELLSEKIPFKLVSLDDSNLTGIQLENGKIFYPEQILAYLFKCFFDILRMKDKNIDQIVLTASPWMNETQRKIILDAASVANIKITSLLESTTAAAISYVKIHDSKFPLEKENATNSVLIDFGDVSFNVSVAKLSQQSVEILSCVSDKSIGGRQFTDLLQEHLLNKVEQKYKISPRNNKRAMLRFNQAVEKVKKTLSTNSIFIFEVASLMNDIDISIPVKREEFVQLIQDSLSKISSSLELALKKAKVTKESIKQIEILGGSSRIPCVKQTIKDFFGKEPTMSLDLDECFAIGAGYMASKIDGNDIGLEVINNVLPYQISFDSPCIDENNIKSNEQIAEDCQISSAVINEVESTENNTETEQNESKEESNSIDVQVSEIESNEPKVESNEESNSIEVQVSEIESNESNEPKVESNEETDSIEVQVNNIESNESNEPKVESNKESDSIEVQVNEIESNESNEQNVESNEESDSIEVQVNEIESNEKVVEIESQQEETDKEIDSEDAQKAEENEIIEKDPKVLFEQYSNLPNQTSFSLPINGQVSFQLKCNDDIIGEGIIETNLEHPVTVEIGASIDQFGIVSINSATYSINGEDTINANFTFKRFNVLSKQMIDKFSKLEEEMQLKDQIELEIDEIKNDIEREFFDTYKLINTYENSEEKNKFTLIKEWIDENEFNRLPLEEYKTKLNELKSIQNQIQKEIETEKKIKDNQQKLKEFNEKLMNYQKIVKDDKERIEFKESIELQSEIEKIAEEIQAYESPEQILNVDFNSLTKILEEIEKKTKELKEIPLPKKQAPVQSKKVKNNQKRSRQSDPLAGTWSPFNGMANGLFGGMWDDPWSTPRRSYIQNNDNEDEDEQPSPEQIKMNEEMEMRKKMQQEAEEKRRQQIELEKQRRIREAEEKRKYIEMMKQKEEMIRQQKIQEEQQRAAEMQRRQRNRFDPWSSFNPQSSYNPRAQNPFYQPRQQRAPRGYYPFGW